MCVAFIMLEFKFLTRNSQIFYLHKTITRIVPIFSHASPGVTLFSKFSVSVAFIIHCADFYYFFQHSAFSALSQCPAAMLWCTPIFCLFLKFFDTNSSNEKKARFLTITGVDLVTEIFNELFIAQNDKTKKCLCWTFDQINQILVN